jgi:hypothetical protein
MQLWPRAGRAVLAENVESETGEIISRKQEIYLIIAFL